MAVSRTLRIAGVASAAVAAGAGVWLLRTFDPNAAGSPFPPCMFHAFTGLYCIGCGLTRALHALVHGDVARAFGMNPLAMALLFLSPLLAAWKLGVWRPAAMRPLVAALSEPRLWLVLLPAYWIARNLPWPPFHWLAPGGLNW